MENKEVETKKADPNTPIQPKESKTWMAVVAAVLVVLFLVVLTYGPEDASEIIDRDTTICIAENSAFYGTEWCGYCKKQKELFGTNVDLLNYIDCDINPQACVVAEIKVFPTWIINGTKYTGLTYEDELKELTGC